MLLCRSESWQYERVYIIINLLNFKYIVDDYLSLRLLFIANQIHQILNKYSSLKWPGLYTEIISANMGINPGRQGDINPGGQEDIPHVFRSRTQYQIPPCFVKMHISCQYVIS